MQIPWLSLQVNYEKNISNAHKSKEIKNGEFQIMIPGLDGRG